MFWSKRKAVVKHQSSELYQLADRLGVERRQNVRVRYPRIECKILPTVQFEDKKLRVHDISAGGCCLLDAEGWLGPSIGTDVHLVLRWPDGAASVHGRIVSRVDHRRHIQFLNLPAARAEQIKAAISPGIRALSMRPVIPPVEQGPSVDAREMWSSIQGDTVIIEDHMHRLAQITLWGTQYTLYKHAWPVKGAATPLGRNELTELILFLSNIPVPSELLTALIGHMESMSLEGAV